MATGKSNITTKGYGDSSKSNNSGGGGKGGQGGYDPNKGGYTDPNTGKFYPTTNPNFRPGGNNSGVGGGGSQGTTSNPTSGTGVRYETNVPGYFGYAAPGVTVTYGTGGAARQRVSGTRYGDNRLYTTATGQRVNVYSSNPSQATIANREAAIRQAAIEGRQLTEQQNAFLKQRMEEDQVRKEGVKIAVDYEGVRQQNEQFRQAGINDAGDFFREARAGNIELKGNQIFVNRIIKTEEEAEIYEQETTRKDREIYIPNKKDQQNYYGVTDRFILRAKQGILFARQNKGFKQKLEGYSFATVSTIYAGASAAFEPVVWAATSKGSFPEGVSEEDLYSGRYEYIKEKEGRQRGEGGFMLGVFATGTSLKIQPAKTSIFVEARNSWILQNPEKDAGYIFNPNSFTIEGRQGVIVPSEYKGGFGIQGIKIGGNKIGFEVPNAQVSVDLRPDLVGKAPELQTQLYPKKVNLDSQSMFAPETYKPMSFFELSRSGQGGAELARKLAVEEGQTVFEVAPNRFKSVADLSPEQRLSLAKDSIKPNDFQRALSEFKEPETLVSEKAKLTGEYTLKTESGENVKLFSADPISATFISVFERPKVLERPNLNFNTKGGSGDLYPSGSFDRPPVSSGARIPVLVGGSRSNSDNSLFQNNNLGSDNRINIRDKNESSIIPVNINVMSFRPETEVFTRSNLRQRQNTAQELQITQEIQTESKVSSFFTSSRASYRPVEPVKDKKPKLPPVVNFGGSGSTERRKGGFDVLVKRRGRFLKVNKFALTRSGAISFGADFVGRTSAASFKVVQSKQAARESKVKRVDFGKFYQNKQGVFVEKSAFRIDTPGERGEITDRGQAKVRFNNVFQRRGKGKSIFG